MARRLTRKVVADSTHVWVRDNHGETQGHVQRVFKHDGKWVVGFVTLDNGRYEVAPIADVMEVR